MALERVFIIMAGTVKTRDGGGVEYTQDECANIIEHGVHAGVASMKTLGSQIENSFRQRAQEVFSTRKTKGQVRAVAVPSYETYKDIQDATGLLLYFISPSCPSRDNQAVPTPYGRRPPPSQGGGA